MLTVLEFFHDSTRPFLLSGAVKCPLLREPLFALLHVLIQEEGHITDNERENDLGKELGGVPELVVEGGTDVWREGGVERRDGAGRRSLRVLVEDLGCQEKLREALYIHLRRVETIF